jgi:hypothetical protein
MGRFRKIIYNIKRTEKEESRLWLKNHKHKVFEKYDSMCCICGLRHSFKNRLHCHHIKYTKNINDIVLLCANCHKKIHSEVKNE